MTAPTREQLEEWKREAAKLALAECDPTSDPGGYVDAVWKHAEVLARAFGKSQAAAAGSGAELVREVEGVREERGPRWTAHALVQRWPRLRAALLSGDAAREDAERLREEGGQYRHAIRYWADRFGKLSTAVAGNAEGPAVISAEILRMDAERYRWLRRNRLWLKANLPMIAAQEFDAAIDRARGGK